MFSQAITYFLQRRNALVTFPRTCPRPCTFSSTATGGCNLGATRRIKHCRIKHSALAEHYKDTFCEPQTTSPMPVSRTAQNWRASRSFSSRVRYRKDENLGWQRANGNTVQSMV